MADISKLVRLFNGAPRHVDLASNTLVVDQLKVGGGAGTNLTKTILDNLISLQNGSDIAASLHHHDGRYRTETELSSVSATSGASLIGVETISGVTGNDVQTVMEDLKAQINAITSDSDFADDVFRISDQGDSSKKIAFEASGISASTVRTATMPNKDITLAGINNETFTGTSNFSHMSIAGQQYGAIHNNGNSGAAKTIDWNEGNTQRVTLTGNVTFTFSNGQDGAQYLLILDQDGTGGRSVTWPASVEFIGPTPSILQAASARTIVSFFYDASEASQFQGLSSNDIVSMANGGTGANLSAVAGGIVYTDANSMEVLAAGAAYQLLQSNGASAPSWVAELQNITKVTLASAAAPTVDAELANKKYVDDQAALKVSKAGDTMSGNLAMGSNKVTGLANGTAAGDAVNKSQLDTKPDSTAVMLLNGTQSMTAAMSLGGFKIGSLADPTLAQDAATKFYVDSVAAGLDPKQSVRVATTANISLASAPAAIDGVTLASGNRVLVRAQTDAKENGIYVFNGSGSAMTRAADHDGSPASEVSGGNFTFVEEGSTYSDSGWVLIGNGILTLGTDNIDWAQFSGAGQIIAGEGLSKTGNTLDVDHDGQGLQFVTNQLALELDGATLSKSASGLKVAALGIGTAQLADDSVTKAKINADIAGSGLSQDVDDSLKVNVDGSSIEISADTLQVKAAGITSSHLAAAIAGNGLSGGAGSALEVNVDGSTLEISADALRIKDDGVTAAKINLDVAGNGIIQEGSGALGLSFNDLSASRTGQLADADLMSVFDTFDSIQKKVTMTTLAGSLSGSGLSNGGAGSININLDGQGLMIDTDQLVLELDGGTLSKSATGLKVANAGITQTQIASSSFSEGIQGGSGASIKLDVNGLTAEPAIVDGDYLVFYDVSAGLHRKILRSDLLGNQSTVIESMVCGEAFAANTTFLVRMALTGETAGRIYKADIDASVSDKFHVFGLIMSTSAKIAGDSVNVLMLGEHTQGSSDAAFAAGDVGKPVFLSTSGAFTVTAPSAANEAIFKVGVVKTTTKIQVNGLQLMGIN